MNESGIGQIKRKKTEQEGKAVGKTDRMGKAVPDGIRKIKDKAYYQYEKDQTGEQLFPYRDPSA